MPGDILKTEILNDLNDLDLNDRIGMNWFNTDKRY